MDLVVVKNKKFPEAKGLFISRILGYPILHDVGVSWEPGMSIVELDRYSKFIIIGSGLWEIMSNADVVGFIL